MCSFFEQLDLVAWLIIVIRIHQDAAPSKSGIYFDVQIKCIVFGNYICRI